MTLTEITLVYQFETLISLIFKLTKEQEVYVNLSINNDGESFSIKVLKQENFISNIGKPDTYEFVRINSNSDHELVRILGEVLTRVDIGFEESKMGDMESVYYALFHFGSAKCLFFNNGDDGYFTLDKIKDILSNDIYKPIWLYNFRF